MPGDTIVVTGATGFIGRALVLRLAADGAAVTALVREAKGRPARAGLPPAVQVQEVDLRYAAGVERAIDAAAPTLVIHLAAAGVTDPFLPVREVLRGNLDATLNVLRAVRGRCRVLAARTPGELDALNPYAASKAAAWQFCRMYQRTEGWPILGVMPFQVYGPGQPVGAVLGAALRAALAGEDFPMSGGQQKRDWVYIDDVVDGMLAAARASGVEGETIELGTGRATPLLDIVGELFRLVGRGQPRPGLLPSRPGEAPEQRACADLTERLIGWRARVDWPAGLRMWVESEMSLRGQD